MASDAIEAVYIASPNSRISFQTQRFCSIKNMSCAVPLASNLAEVDAAIAFRARDNQVVPLEALSRLPAQFPAAGNRWPKIGRMHKAFLNYCQYSHVISAI